MGGRRALPVAALARPCRAGRNASIAMDLEAFSAPIVGAVAGAGKQDTDTTYSFNIAPMALLPMDARVKKAILAKIDETISGKNEIAKIQQSLGHIPVGSQDDFAFGIAIGRIYNSFHYQTRRALERNATDKEFAEFLDILAEKAGKIRNALKQQ